MKYLRRFILWPLLFLLILIVGVIGYVAGAPSGLQQILSLGQKYAPGELSWTKAEGKLFGPLDLENLSFKQPDGIEVSLKDASFRWTPTALFSRTVKIDQLHLTGLDIHLPPPTEVEPEPEASKEEIQLPDIKLPVQLSLNDIQLAEIRIYPHGADAPILVEKVQLVAAGENEQLKLVDLNVTAPEASLKIEGYVQPQGDYPIDLELQWAYKHEQFGAFKGNGALDGSLQDLNIKHELSGVIESIINGNVKQALNKPDWDIDLSAKSKDLSSFSEALLNAPLNAKLSSKGGLENFSFNGDIDTALKQTGALNLKLNGNGNTSAIDIDEVLLALKETGGFAKISGAASIEEQSVDLKGNWEKLAWPIKTDTPEFLSPSGDFAVDGNMENFNVSLNTNVDGKLLSPLQATLKAEGKNQEITLKSLAVNGKNSDLQLTSKGIIDLKDQEFDLKGNWQALAWPMKGDAQFSSPKGDFSAKGDFSNYSFNADTALSGTDIPSGQWSIKGKGTDKSLPEFSVDGSTLGGQIKTSGQASWTPLVSWDVDVSASEVDPGRHWPELPGNLNLKLESAGSIKETGPSLTAKILRLDGVLKEKPVSGQGLVTIEGATVNVDQLTISSGETNLAANGVLSDQWDLNFELAAKELDHWSDALGGQLTAEGKITGTPKFPVVNTMLSAKNLKSGANSLEDLKGTIAIDASGKAQSKIDILVKNIEAAGQNWENLSLQGSGKPDQHSLALRLNGELAQIQTKLSGGLKNNNSWLGQLTELSALKTEFGDWQLEKPANLKIQATAAQASPICLGSEPTQVCLAGDWSVDNGSKGELKLANLEPKRFKRFLPEDIEIDNRINLAANGGMSKSGRLSADADLDISAGKLVLKTHADPTVIDLGSSTIDAVVRGEKVQSDVNLNLGKLGTVLADIGISGFSDRGKLSGNVKPELKDLSVISLLVPQLQEVSGQLTGALSLGGTLGAPQVSGSVDLEEFAAEVPEVAINIEETELHLQGQGNAPLQISGSSKSGGGKLSIEGQLNPQTTFFDMTLKGENYVVADSSHLKAQISPDMKISMNQDGMSVTGKLEVPKAFVDAKGGSGGIETVSGSKDIVIIDENGVAETNKASDNLNVNLQIVLGDDIKVEAGDFSGRLKGNLLVEQTPQLAPRGTGTIEVVNGDYVIYGQQLTMQRGRILFSGGPIDNPRLDMDVARSVDAYEVLAGAKIRGTAQSPLLQLYSEPAMPDASILSYILLGQPPGTKGGSYTLGKFITPDLYVSYGIGLFNAINTFNMRYKLTEKLSLQAASGMANSADLIYTIEK